MPRKNLIYIFSLFVFCAIFIFFTQTHPLTVFDGDDWVSLSKNRIGIPQLGGHNPARVLPEVLFPFMGYIAAYVVFPLVGNYLFSITLVFGAVLALLVSFLYFMFVRMCRNLVGLPDLSSCVLGLLFIVLHFSFLKSQQQDNIYLLYSSSMTTYGYYVVSSLVNAIAVLYFMGTENVQGMFNKLEPIKKGLFLIVLYLVIFSNLFQSAILAIFCFSYMLWEIWKNTGNVMTRVKQCYQENKLYSWIVIVWLITLICEATGGDAKYVGNHPLMITDAALNIFKVFALTSRYTVIFIVLVVLSLIGLRRKMGHVGYLSYFDKVNHMVVLSSISCLLIFIYLILLCSKTGAGYAARMESIYGIFFYVLVTVLLLLGMVMKRIAFYQIILPFFVLILLTVSTTSAMPYRNSNLVNIAHQDSNALSQNLIDQIVAADRSGQKEMVLIVPKGDNRDNWPHPTYMGRNIARTLYEHGLISRKMKIVVQPSEAMNEQYYKK